MCPDKAFPMNALYLGTKSSPQTTFLEGIYPIPALWISFKDPLNFSDSPRSKESIPNGFLDVIIVDDIIDTGYTMQFVIDHVKKLGAKSVKTCVLLDNPSRRKVDLKPDYYCFEIDDLFVVGYGLDYEGFYRNVPYVFNWENK